MAKINKQISLILGIVITVFLMNVSVSAASGMVADNITMVTPIASGTMAGASAVFNCSLDAGYTAENWTSVRVYFQSATLTGNTTETTPTSFVLNVSLLDLSGTVDTTIVEDGNDYTFKCQIWNGTNYLNKTRTGITIDNTIPQATSSLSPSDNSIDRDGSLTFSGTVTGVNTTSCTLNFNGINPGSSSYAMIHTGDTCTYTLSNTPEQTYDWFIRASDETNTIDSSQQTITVDIQTSAGKAVLLAQQEGIESRGGAVLAITSAENGLIQGIPNLVLIIIGIVVVIFVIKKYG